MQFTFEAIGTVWTIEIFTPVDQDQAKAILQNIHSRIDEFDRNYSRFRTDSLVTRMSHDTGTYQLPADAEPIFNLYYRLYKITDGLMTPLIGNALATAGYDAAYSFKTGTVRQPPDWQTALNYNFPSIHIKQSVLLDFGAAGKGYLTDILGRLLEKQGIYSFCINAGGDILYRTADNTNIQVALENPADSKQAIGVATFHNQSLCGSSGNRRTWGIYHHILNPQSLQSPRHLTAVWVVADSGLLADGLATALFFTNPVKLRTHFSFEYAIVHSDFSLDVSSGFPADFFTSNVMRQYE